MMPVHLKLTQSASKLTRSEEAGDLGFKLISDVARVEFFHQEDHGSGAHITLVGGYEIQEKNLQGTVYILNEQGRTIDRFDPETDLDDEAVMEATAWTIQKVPNQDPRKVHTQVAKGEMEDVLKEFRTLTQMVGSDDHTYVVVKPNGEIYLAA